jgi:hypothetical protein
MLIGYGPESRISCHYFSSITTPHQIRRAAVLVLDLLKRTDGYIRGWNVYFQDSYDVCWWRCYTVSLRVFLRVMLDFWTQTGEDILLAGLLFPVCHSLPKTFFWRAFFLLFPVGY